MAYENYKELALTRISNTSGYIDVSSLSSDSGLAIGFKLQSLKFIVRNATANETYYITVNANSIIGTTSASSFSGGDFYSSLYVWRDKSPDIIPANGRINISITSTKNNVELDFEQKVKVFYNVRIPTGLTSATITGSDVYSNIITNVGLGNTNAFNLRCVKGSSVVFDKNIKSNTYTIPPNTLDVGTYTFEFSALSMSDTGLISDKLFYATREITAVRLSPTISNLINTGDFWEQDIVISWRGDNQEGYEYELYYNNSLIKSGEGGTEKSFLIKANTYSGILNPTVRVRAYRIVSGLRVYSAWVEKSLSLKDITATITSLLVEGDYWEKPIKVSWQSTNQQQFKIELFKSNMLIQTYTGTTVTSYTIPAEVLSEGQHTIRVTVAYANRFVNTAERTVTFKNIIPTIDNLVISGSNIDLNLILSWTSTDQQKFEVDIQKNDLSVKTYTGTVANLVNIVNNTLTTGLHKFRVRVGYKDRWSEWQETSSTLTETLPSIGVLEPDGIITKRDEPTVIRWTSQNQSKWKILIDNVHEYTGTTEKELIISPGTFTTNRHSILLTVWYVTGLGVEKTPVTKKAEWVVQGIPPRPTITSGSQFATNRPLITWDTQDQQAYILELLKDNIVLYSTDWQNGLIVEHKVLEYLPNGTYTVRVKVMNKYELESDYGTKQIIINAAESTNIALESIQVQNTVYLKWNNINNVFKIFYILRNDVVIGVTADTSYMDYVPHRDCVYTVRGITNADVYKDSNNSYEYVEISRSVLCTVDKLDDQLNCAFFSANDRFNATLGLECKLLEVSGREYQIAIFGEHSTKTVNLKLIQCESLDKLIEMFNRRQVFCYRDATEKIYFIMNTLNYDRNSISSDHGGALTVNVVSYKEGINYE